MAKRKNKVIPFSKEVKITYNKYKPNRKARRLGIEAKVPPQKEEEKALSKVAILMGSVQKAKEIEKKILPQGVTCGEYMAYLKEKCQQLEQKKFEDF